MSENFKILIAYDGSACADIALEDLKFAGLPAKKVEAVIVSVAEVWLPPSNADTEDQPNFLTESLRKKQEKSLKIFEETKFQADSAAEKVLGMFPGWNVQPEATYGSPAWEVLARADDFKPDLIVVGSQGLSMLKRIWLGSVSQRIATEAKSSVRVARKIAFDMATSPIRLILAFDGTAGAETAFESVRSRQWPKDTEIRVVIVEDLVVVLEAFSFEQSVSDLEKRGKEVVAVLNGLGLKALLRVVDGNPKELIVREAEEFQANCIFVGANQFSGTIERIFLGSVSSAITSRAECSVEVVRQNFYDSEGQA